MADAPHTTSDDDAWARRTTAAIAAGSRDALASLYERRFGFLFRVVRDRIRCDESFALDCVQDAMLSVARSLSPMHSAAALDAWLRRTVLRAALDRLRSEARRRQREARVARPERDAGAPSDPLAELEAELAVLDSEVRALLDLRFRRGLTLSQLGATTGLAPKAADSRLRRAIARLRRALGGDATPSEPLEREPL